MHIRSLAPFALWLLPLTLLACSSSSDAPATGGDASTDTATATDSSGTDSAAPADGAGGDGAGSDGGGTDGAAGDTWDSYAKGFFAKYCVECHAGGKRDYRTPANVVRDLALIRCGVASTTQSGCTASDPAAKQFPIDNATATNPKPTDAERDRIVAWLAAGAP